MIVEIRNKYTNNTQVRFDIEVGLNCVFITNVSKINFHFLQKQNINPLFIENDLIQWIKKRNQYKEDVVSDYQILKILDYEKDKNKFGRMLEYSYAAMLLTYFDIGDEYIITPASDEFVCFYYLNPYLYKIYHLEVYSNDFNA